MLAIERTTKAFVASARAAGFDTRVDRSRNAYGRSNYVYLVRKHPLPWLKVRISDHAVGMRRAHRGDDDLFLHAGATVDHWSVWLSRRLADAIASGKYRMEG